MNQIRSMSFTQEKSYAVLLVILCAFVLQGCMGREIGDVV
jgi:hypothetical protein